MARERVADGDVAQPVQRVDLLLHAAQATSRAAIDTVGAVADADDDQRETQTRREASVLDELLHGGQVLLVDEDGDAHRATREGWVRVSTPSSAAGGG